MTVVRAMFPGLIPVEICQEKFAALGGAAGASHEGRLVLFVGDDVFAVVLLLVLFYIVVLVALAVVLLVALAVTLLVRFGGGGLGGDIVLF